MGDELKRIPAAFYRSSNGTEPVRDWLKSLAPEDRRVLGHDIGLVEFGWPVGMPLCRSLGQGLWKIRSTLPSDRVARVIFCVAHGHLVLLHGFIKTSQKTPLQDLTLARKRQRDVENG